MPNEKVEQLAANRLTIPQDVIASLLQRLVRHALASLVARDDDSGTAAFELAGIAKMHDAFDRTMASTKQDAIGILL